MQGIGSINFIFNIVNIYFLFLLPIYIFHISITLLLLLSERKHYDKFQYK